MSDSNPGILDRLSAMLDSVFGAPSLSSRVPDVGLQRSFTGEVSRRASSSAAVSQRSSRAKSSSPSSVDDFGPDSSIVVARVLEYTAEMFLGGLILFFTHRWLAATFGQSEADAKAAQQGRKALRRVEAQKGVRKIITTEYENIILQDAIDPSDIDVTFSSIGGLEEQKRDIVELVVLPLRRPDMFRVGKLLSPPRGILLYGPPGTGKTMIAKAIAKESGATFIDLKLSTIMNKYYGESQKLTRAAFSIAKKLAPTIIFIDEIDSLMKKRGSDGDNSATKLMVAEFMALWDGMATGGAETDGYGVMILGATNRPYDVDPAILRRMPRTFQIRLPNAADRENILRLILAGAEVDENLSYEELAARLEGYSGSDLKALCQAAAMLPVRECIERASRLAESVSEEEDVSVTGICEHLPQDTTVRALILDDFLAAMQKVRPTGATAREYFEEEIRRGNVENRTFLEAFAQANPDVQADRDMAAFFAHLAVIPRD